MRKSFLFVVFIVLSLVAKAQFTVYQPAIPNPSRSTPIVPKSYGPFTTYTPSSTVVRGKTYNAIIFYESSSGQESTYKLPVVVNNGSVDKICFNDGGSVHVGINNSGYNYYGGKLEYIEDIEAYATEVTVVYPNFWQKFTVIIQ